MATAGFYRNLRFLLFRGAATIIFLLLLGSSRALDINTETCPTNCSCSGYSVDCSNRGFITVPQNIPLSTLRLDLSRNEFQSLEIDSLQHLTALEELKMDHNYLTNLNFVGHLKNLTTVIVHHNHIRTLSQRFFQSLPALRVLDLSHNRLSKIPNATFPNETQLNSLSLNNNRIAHLEKGCLDNLTNLEILRLNKNRLQKLPKDLFIHLKSLKTLLLNQNRIIEVESLTFKGLNSLENLKLHENNISALHDGAFWELRNMKKLRLDSNNISEVARGWLYGLTSLEHLSLKHNSIVEILDNSWEFCEKLSYLDISHNYIQSLRKGAFARLPRLMFLILEHNNISFIEGSAFKGLSHLQKLNMNTNHISWTIEDMMGAFLGLDNLQSLGLASNLIKSIAKYAFKGLEQLVDLDLNDNPIMSVQNNAFAGMKSLQELQMNSNSFLCDCQLQWFPEWFSSAGFKTKLTATCAHPERMKASLIVDGKAEDFICNDFPKPYFIEEPQTQVVLKSDNVSLVCQAGSSSSSELTSQWKRDNMILHHAHVENFAKVDGYITVYYTVLKLFNVSHTDEGRYQCVIANEFGATYSQKAKITVHVFPTFTKTPVDITIKAGSTARLECAAQGFPTPQIAWQKDGGDDFPAARERRMHVMPSDEVFFIVNVKAADMGTYSCTAQNTAGLVMANFSLSVLEVPSFIKPMEDKEARVGKTAVLECMAAGSPKPRLTWSKEGVVLGANERHFFTADDQLLIIVQTQLSDTGAYSCSMTNPLGTETGTAFLRVEPSELGDESMTGIIIIAVVCCVVGTSLIWVVIIYKTRKSRDDFLPNPGTDMSLPPELTGGGYSTCVVSCSDEIKGCTTHVFTDDNSEHSSKDSGNGDSVKRSCENLISSDAENGKRSAANGSRRLALLQAEYSNSSCNLKGTSESSMESLQSSSGAPTVSNYDSVGRPRECSDPTFRTFLLRPSNHDRTNENSGNNHHRRRADFDAAELSENKKCLSSRHSQSQYDVVQLGSSAERDRSKVFYPFPSEDGRHSTNRNYSSTFPRSVSLLLDRNSDSTLHSIRPPQEAQNDSGSFSIVSEEASMPNVKSRTSNSSLEESPLNYGKISLPNLTHVGRAVPSQADFNKKQLIPTCV